MSARVRMLLLAVCGALLLAGTGCGGDGDDSGGGSTDATATATADTDAENTATPEPAATIDVVADKEIAEAGLLTLDDVPSGWTEEPDDDNVEKSPCDGIEQAKQATSARDTSATYSESSDTQTQNTVYVFGDEHTAQEGFAKLTSEDTRECIAEELGKQLAKESDLDVGDVRAARLSMDPLGDEREAARLTVPVTRDGVDVDLVIDMRMTRVGRAADLMLFLNTFSPFDEDLAADLTSSTVRRLSAAQAE